MRPKKALKKFRKRLLRSLALWLFAPLCSFIIKLLYFSGKKVFHLPKNIPQEPFIVAFWHGDMIFQPFLYYQLRKTPNINVIISSHFDGQFIAKIISFLKLNTIHGSSSKNAVRVLITAMKILKKGGDVAITPDGPKGPRHEIADGIIVMAQKTKAKIIIFSCVPSRYWKFKSWDQFTIPKPFSHLDFYASEPLDLTDMEKNDAKRLIKETFMAHDY